MCSQCFVVQLCDHLHGSRNHCQTLICHGSGASVAESTSVLLDAATHGIVNSELTNCGRTAAVLRVLTAQLEQMMAALQRVPPEKSSLNLDVDPKHEAGNLIQRGRSRRPRLGPAVVTMKRRSEVHAIESHPCGAESWVRGNRGVASSGGCIRTQGSGRPSDSVGALTLTQKL